MKPGQSALNIQRAGCFPVPVHNGILIVIDSVAFSKGTVMDRFKQIGFA